ncbi:aminotransferase class V-fold PLP-dependent enzyme [Sulfobacillus thermosulfidooxidans]|uniref:aminotransferase class V-fold PLP-dependent enzyme n=1 Tax=Sulfobacillus thermosulfidooxidans TaxID=28034 RepID=UPI0006B3FE44|nr:aminotransferase class V-fold PLP-dependent enzyme [Sulfobacillus thermosulfidooxidans]
MTQTWPSWHQLVSRSDSRRYFNIATSSPLLDLVKNAMITALNEEPMHATPWEQTEYVVQRTRQVLSQLLGVPSETVAITTNTTQGLHLILNGIRWMPDDEIIVSTDEHASTIIPVFAVQKRFGLTVRLISTNWKEPCTSQDLIHQLETLVTPLTRLIILSHVTWNTGRIRPLDMICRWARNRGIKTLVEGAQGIGHVDVSWLRDGDCDAYAFPGHKWLCGPPGTGALWVHPSWIEEIWPSQPGYCGIKSFAFNGAIQWQDGVKRLESSTRNITVLAGWLAVLQYLRDLGFPRITQRIYHLYAYFIRLLTNSEILSQCYWVIGDAGIVTLIPRKAWDIKQLTATLQQYGIICRHIVRPHGIRFSLHAFNTEKDIDFVIYYLLELTRSISSSSPSVIKSPLWWEE